MFRISSTAHHVVPCLCPACLWAVSVTLMLSRGWSCWRGANLLRTIVGREPQVCILCFHPCYKFFHCYFIFCLIKKIASRNSSLKNCQRIPSHLMIKITPKPTPFLSHTLSHKSGILFSTSGVIRTRVTLWSNGSCMKVKSLSRVRLFATPWTVAHQAPLSMGFSRQGYWSGVPFPSPGDLPDPGIEPGSPALQADALPSEPPGKPWQLYS